MRSDWHDLTAILFDFDGVLFDTTIAINAAWRQAAAGIGRTLSDRELRDHVHGRGAKETLGRLFSDLTTDEKAALHRVVDQVEEAAPCPPLPGVAEFLASIAALGLPCGLVTGSWDSKIDGLFRRNGLPHPFLFRITRASTTRGKPDPEPYAMALAKLADRGADGTVVAFEDSPAGVQSACAAGCLCVGVQGNDNALGAALRQAGAGTTVADFRDTSVVKAGPGTFKLSLEPARLLAGYEAGA